MSIRRLSYVEASLLDEGCMPFGKHRGRKIAEIEDVKYLDWLLGTEIPERLSRAILDRLENDPEWQRLMEED